MTRSVTRAEATRAQAQHLTLTSVATGMPDEEQLSSMQWQTFRRAHPLNTCFTLLSPVLVWNVLFAARLPALYANEEAVPAWLQWVEHGTRLLAFGGTCFLPIVHERWLQESSWRTALREHQSTQLWVLFATTALYFASWLPLLVAPDCDWSVSAAGVLAPGYTPLLFLLGLAWIGRSWPYVAVSVLFVATHLTATYFKFPT